MDDEYVPRHIISRDYRMIGRCTGGTRRCSLEGCGGYRIGVRWPDKKLTWLCVKGLENITEDIWKLR